MLSLCCVYLAGAQLSFGSFHCMAQNMYCFAAYEFWVMPVNAAGVSWALLLEHVSGKLKAY